MEIVCRSKAYRRFESSSLRQREPLILCGFRGFLYFRASFGGRKSRISRAQRPAMPPGGLLSVAFSGRAAWYRVWVRKELGGGKRLLEGPVCYGPISADMSIWEGKRFFEFSCGNCVKRRASKRYIYEHALKNSETRSLNAVSAIRASADMTAVSGGR